MWLFLPFGFFSIVQKHGDDFLTVRSRNAGDLDNLRTRVPELTETLHTPNLDYQYRATVDAAALAAGLGQIVQAIDYDNFKAEVSKQQGSGRAGLYGLVWGTLGRLWDGY